MKVYRRFRTDSCAHAACHTLEAVIRGLFFESSLECVDHEASGLACAFKGYIQFEEDRYQIEFGQLSDRMLEISIESSYLIAEQLLDRIITAYSRKKDAGGFNHILKMVNAGDISETGGSG